VKTRLVRIGNLLEIRIPKEFVQQAGIGEEVDICIEKNSLVIRSAAKTRAGWAVAFVAMAKSGDDAMLDDDPQGLSRWDEDGWEWS
jgi:antitoxin MazE